MVLRFITKSSPIRNCLVKTTFIVTRTMSGDSKNEDLKANKLFDVSNYTAVVTGGGQALG
jgi:hypothetical protein